MKTSEIRKGALYKYKGILLRAKGTAGQYMIGSIHGSKPFKVSANFVTKASNREIDRYFNSTKID